MSMLCVEVKSGYLFRDKLRNKFDANVNPGGVFVGALNKEGRD